MSSGSRSAQVVVSRLMSRASALPEAAVDPRDAAVAPPSSDAPDPVRAAEEVFEDVADSLSRALGPYGYHALLARALTKARLAHPALAGIRIRSAMEPYLDGLHGAASEHGLGALSDGLHATLAILVDLLGRLIGEDLAILLVSEAISDESAGGNGPKSTGAPDSISPGDPGHLT